VFNSAWPQVDENQLKTKKITMVVQINGKVRSQIEVEPDSKDDAVVEIVQKDSKVRQYTEGKKIVKIIVVKNKLVSIAVKDN
jgi:leucyl-tRNA synthetase